MIVSPDRSTLYIALLDGEHGESLNTGAIAVFDLASRSLLRTFPIELYPMDLALTAAGILVVEQNHDYGGEIASYDVVSGGRIDNLAVSLGFAARISVPPSGRNVYAASGDGIAVFKLSPEGVFSPGPEFLVPQRAVERVWVSPSEEMLLTSMGDLFTCCNPSGGLSLDRVLSPVPLQDVAYDETAGLILTAQGNEVVYYDRDTFKEVVRQTLPLSIDHLQTDGLVLYVAEVRDGVTRIGSVAHAGSNGEQSMARQAHITGIPEPGPFVLPFPAADVLFDPNRGVLYATDLMGQSLNVVNLDTGLIERVYGFAFRAESLAMTPDGSRLFVALLTRDHSPTWWDRDGHEGYIASLDLSTESLDRIFHITEDPYDLVASGAFTADWDSIYYGQHRMDGNLWVDPTGEFLITRGGDVFSTTGDSPATDMLFLDSLSPGEIEALVYDTPQS